MDRNTNRYLAILKAQEILEDLERDAVWLIQHGHESQTYAQIHDGLKLLDSQRKTLKDQIAKFKEEIECAH